MKLERILISPDAPAGATPVAPGPSGSGDLSRLILAFGPAEQLRAPLGVAALARRFPGVRIAGSSSCSVVLGTDLHDDGLVAISLSLDHGRMRLADARIGTPSASFDAGLALGRALAGPELAGVLVLAPGTGVNGSLLADGLQEAVGPDVPISGGLASDGARFVDAPVVLDDRVLTDHVVAIGFYGAALSLSHGSAGGWDEFGPVRRITRSDGAILHSLDDQPALALYERYLGEEAQDLPASGLLYPLKIWDPDRPSESVVRSLVGIDRENGCIRFIDDLPMGWNARLMRGVIDNLTAGAAEAATAARTRLGDGAEGGLCIFVSCVGRRLVLGQRTPDEVDSLIAALPPGALAVGFYSHGEISPHSGTGRAALHNQTATLLLLGERDP